MVLFVEQEKEKEEDKLSYRYGNKNTTPWKRTPRLFKYTETKKKTYTRGYNTKNSAAGATHFSNSSAQRNWPIRVLNHPQNQISSSALENSIH